MPPDYPSNAAALRSRWQGLPAWLLSLAVHWGVAILAAVLFRFDPPAGTDEADRPATIVLARRSTVTPEYFSEDASTPALRHLVRKPAADAAAAGGSAYPTDQPPTMEGVSLPDFPGALPAGEGLVAAPSPTTGGSRGPLFPGLDDAAILAEDARIPREAAPTGPTARVSLFGTPAEGRSFVFVIDRSKSMGSDGLGVIRAAANELQEQLDALTGEQELQVVAYNQSPAMLGERKLLPATQANKDRLVHFVANLAAFGQTEHSPALLAALRLKPEVVFLLTDGGDPVLHEGQLRVIREAAAGRTTIHCLHFGRGAAGGESFLGRLAAQNRGQYVYIDVTRP